MTTKDWFKEFYPCPPSRDMSRLEAAEHSLRKWQGVAQREQYRLQVNGMRQLETVRGTAVLDLDSSTCALCQISTCVDEGEDYPEIDCQICPLVEAGFPRCGEVGSAFQAFYTSGDPSELVDQLTVTVERERAAA